MEVLNRGGFSGFDVLNVPKAQESHYKIGISEPALGKRVANATTAFPWGLKVWALLVYLCFITPGPL